MEAAMKKLLMAHNQRPVAYYPIHAQIAGSIPGGVVLSQLMYWFAASGKNKIWKTDRDLMAETGIGQNALTRLKKKLKSLKFMSITLKGLPPKTWYELNLDEYQSYVLPLLPDPPKDDSQKPRSNIPGNLEYCSPKPRKLVPKPSNITPRNGESIKGTESTSETTPETTNLKSTGEANPNGIPEELQGLELYEDDLKLIERWPSLLASWRKAYPRLSIASEVAKAHAWEMANPSKRKKQKARFLGNWLSHAKPPPARASGHPEPGDPGWDEYDIQRRAENERRKAEFEREMKG